MAEEMSTIVIAEGAIVNKIYWIRGQKVMLDQDLAELYGVETKSLKRQVKRNIDRFPEDFMFELNEKEFENWRYQNGTTNGGKSGDAVERFEQCVRDQGQYPDHPDFYKDAGDAAQLQGYSAEVGATRAADPSEYGGYSRSFRLFEAVACPGGTGGA